jgi:hypothetical protein
MSSSGDRNSSSLTWRWLQRTLQMTMFAKKRDPVAADRLGVVAGEGRRGETFQTIRSPLLARRGER